MPQSGKVWFSEWEFLSQITGMFRQFLSHISVTFLIMGYSSTFPVTCHGNAVHCTLKPGSWGSDSSQFLSTKKAQESCDQRRGGLLTTVLKVSRHSKKLSMLLWALSGIYIAFESRWTMMISSLQILAIVQSKILLNLSEPSFWYTEISVEMQLVRN